MRHKDVTLDDKFLLTEGRVFITGVQALLRILLDQPASGLAVELAQSPPLSRRASGPGSPSRPRALSLVHGRLRL